MNDPITYRAQQILAQSERLLMPLNDLYRRLAAEGLVSWISEDMFEYLIATDERFQLLEGLGDSGMMLPGTPSGMEVRQMLGSPLVMLQESQFTPKAMLRDILSYLKEMNQALEAAWHMRPEDAPEVEAELMNMLIMGEILERELMTALHAYTLLDDLVAQETARDP